MFESAWADRSNVLKKGVEKVWECVGVSIECDETARLYKARVILQFAICIFLIF